MCRGYVVVMLLSESQFAGEAAALMAAFTAQRLTLAVAESCTGGLVSKAVTDVSGASSFFLGGVVAYHNDLKQGLLGVGRKTLLRHGAVSRECALEMARGVRRATGADVGISVTGIAGPSGATPAKPVGLVFIACAAGGWSEAEELRICGGRAEIREAAAGAALALALKAANR